MSDDQPESNAGTRVAVIGCGYVGYPLALVLADAGHEVIAVDTDASVLERISAGEPLEHEPGVSDLARSVHDTGRLSIAPTPPRADVFVIAVPTPLEASTRTADLASVTAAVESIVPVVCPGNLVIVESTVPPGTTAELVATILEGSGLAVGEEVFVAHCPERVFPGNTIVELRSVPRVVGGISDASTAVAAEFYRSFVAAPVAETDATTAEMSKLMENTYRDVNIALANQVSSIAERHGVDIAEAIRIANQHPRVDYLQPGIGVGGHCIPVDPWFLLDGMHDGVIAAARRLNDDHPNHIAEAIRKMLPPDTKTVLLLGSAYKAGVADRRNAPATAIAERLLSHGLSVLMFDPLVDGPFDDTAAPEAAVILVDQHGLESVVSELQASGVPVLDSTGGTVRVRAAG